MSEKPSQTSAAKATEVVDDEPYPMLGVRAAIGGTLMGLANLVPGISGGTMLLASGVYPRFIQAIAELTRLRFRKRSIFTLGVILLCVAVAIVALSGPVKNLVVSHRWVMYSLFIGLTLGGLPVVWKIAKPATPQTWIGAVVGFVPMAVLAYFQMKGAEGGGGTESFAYLFLAGVVGASAMVLPGISGGYMLLVMGVYVTILGAVEACKDAVKAKDFDALMGPALEVVLPVGLGVAIGILVVSNGLKILLERFEKPTLGFLLGLLGGSVFGLWPFQVGVAPALGSTFKGRPVTEEILAELTPDKYPTELFTPSIGQIGGALGLVVVGFVLTSLVAKIGGGKDEAKQKGAAAAAAE
ncbi:MAG: DUF368 domain-containing protein [Sandaracinus sp.]|nr:DUF368 domain-containing protein [Sandaracinus sp.]MCB9616736.1 DUF368 domain-containing protein [Sandaracinus sp.]